MIVRIASTRRWADMSNGRAGMCAKHLIARENCPLARGRRRARFESSSDETNSLNSLGLSSTSVEDTSSK